MNSLEGKESLVNIRSLLHEKEIVPLNSYNELIFTELIIAISRSCPVFSHHAVPPKCNKVGSRRA